MAFDRLLGQGGHPGGNLSINRNISDANLLHRRNQGTCLARMPIEKAFALERGNVLHDRCLAGETKMTLDFARAWRNPFLALLALDKIENVFLTVRQHGLMIAEISHRASSNEQICTFASATLPCARRAQRRGTVWLY